jgi:hypothetical protein
MAILAVAPGGCSNVTGPVPCVGDECPDPPPPPPPVRDTPANAVEYLRLAYENRDSTAADTVLADDYQGNSTDHGTTTTTLSFVKSDEIRALHGLKDDLEITKIGMNWGTPTSWILDQYAGDPPDWVVVKISAPNILVQKTTGSDLAVSSTNLTTFEFKTKPVVSGSQTLWEVVRWTEIHNADSGS